MNSPLYTRDILRLAVSDRLGRRLADPDASVERRSPTCGSRVTVDVRLDAAGAVAEVGVEARACALGQASSALLAEHAEGRLADDIAAAATALRLMLAGADAPTDFWPGIELLASARDYPARHASILLAFEAAAEAAAQARARRLEAGARRHA